MGLSTPTAAAALHVLPGHLYVAGSRAGGGLAPSRRGIRRAARRGGGLSADRSRWVCARGNFLVHVRALSRLFRGKLQARLEDLGLLAEVPPEVWRQDWVVHCETVGDGRAVMKYLGAYVFRVAISGA